MFQLLILVGLMMAAAMIWPELPISKMVIRAGITAADWLRVKATLSRAIIAVSFALLLYAAIWALQGDAPVALAMALPEVAAWFSTFEIATLVDVLVGLGSAWLALRTSGAGRALRSKASARRRRSQRRKATARREANDDDGPARWLAAA